MPILDDIMDHKVLGREFKRGLAEGREQGREEGERRLLLCQIEKRFGPIPSSAQEHFETMTASQLEQAALRLLDASSLEDLLGQVYFAAQTGQVVLGRAIGPAMALTAAR